MWQKQNQTVAGILLAILATLIWSGNFIIARSAAPSVPPVTLAFLRWSCASLIMLPLGWQAFMRDRKVVLQHWPSLAFAALAGVAVFNTLVYVAGHFSAAINLALIGTTSSPIFSFILARIFLKEQIPFQRLLGLLICIAGILMLLSRGSWEVLMHFRFSEGDWWILGAAFSFAVYNIMARKKPVAIGPVSYLFSTFWIGTLMLLPFALWEHNNTPGITWNANLVGMILYLGAGTSVAAFFCWNAAIARLGAARAAIFGNLIPLFSSIEAVLILKEQITWVHLSGMSIIVAGLITANYKHSHTKVAA
jgi:drug/metabolite transporter (DMT)-like permease